MINYHIRKKAIVVIMYFNNVSKDMSQSVKETERVANEIW